MPIKYDAEEAQQMNELFLRMIDEQSALVFGANGERFPQAVKIIATMTKKKLLKTEHVQKVKDLITRMLADPTSGAQFKSLCEELPKKEKEQMKNFMESS